MKIAFDTITIDLTPTGKSYRVKVGDRTAEVEILRADAEHGKLELAH
jgi:hypothetical protein